MPKYPTSDFDAATSAGRAIREANQRLERAGSLIFDSPAFRLGQLMQDRLAILDRIERFACFDAAACAGRAAREASLRVERVGSLTRMFDSPPFRLGESIQDMIERIERFPSIDVSARAQEEAERYAALGTSLNWASCIHALRRFESVLSNSALNALWDHVDRIRHSAYVDAFDAALEHSHRSLLLAAGAPNEFLGSLAGPTPDTPNSDEPAIQRLEVVPRFRCMVCGFEIPVLADDAQFILRPGETLHVDLEVFPFCQSCWNEPERVLAFLDDEPEPPLTLVPGDNVGDGVPIGRLSIVEDDGDEDDN